MVKIKNILILFTAVIVLMTATYGDSDVTTIMVASDIHYISQQLTDNGEYFTDLIEKSDGKVINYIEPITNAFVDEVLETAPDVLVITGDLSFNGALLSHIDFSKKLEPIEKAGIKVLVIPGNHDVNYPYAASFSGTTYKKVDMTTAQQFKAAYADTDMKAAVSTDQYSGSYIYELRNDVWLLMLDTNSLYENTMYRETFDWLEEQLAYAQKNGINVISFSHQNVLRHSNIFFYGYQIYQGEELCQLFRQYGVKLNLSGHMHIQHITEDNGITEILTSALSVYPHQYGTLTLSSDRISYNIHQLDISAWAEKNNITDNILRKFSEYSRNFFINATGSKLKDELIALDVPADNIDRMEETFHITNTAYFSGVSVNVDSIQDGITLWNKYQESFYTIYLNDVWKTIQGGINHQQWTGPLDG